MSSFRAAPVDTAESCLRGEFGAAVITLIILCLILLMVVAQLRAKVAKKHEQNAAMRKRMLADREKMLKDKGKLKQSNTQSLKDEKLIKESEEKIRTLEMTNKALLQEIMARGTVSVDPSVMRFSLKRSIQFTDVKEGLLTGRLAEFAEEQVAFDILKDLAELLVIFPNVCLLIEAHTAGGAAAVGQVGREVADARGALVRATLLANGIPGGRVDALGLPALMGENKDMVVLRTIDV